MKSLKFWKLYYSHFSDIPSYCYFRKIIWFKLQFPEEVIKETRISINDVLGLWHGLCLYLKCTIQRMLEIKVITQKYQDFICNTSDLQGEDDTHVHSNSRRFIGPDQGWRGECSSQPHLQVLLSPGKPLWGRQLQKYCINKLERLNFFGQLQSINH